MIPVTVIAPLQGWKQAQSATGLQFVSHTFESNARGELEHYTDGKLRATIPPEGWADYARAWPEAQPIIDGLTIRPAANDPIFQDPAPEDPPAGLVDFPHQLTEQAQAPFQ